MFTGTPNTAIEQLQKHPNSDLNGSRQESLQSNLESWRGDSIVVDIHSNDVYPGPAYPEIMSDARLVSRIIITGGSNQKLVPANYIQKWPALRWISPSMPC